MIRINRLLCGPGLSADFHIFHCFKMFKICSNPQWKCSLMSSSGRVVAMICMHFLSAWDQKIQHSATKQGMLFRETSVSVGWLMMTDILKLNLSWPADRCESATMHLFKEGLVTIGEYTFQVAANPHFGKCNPGSESSAHLVLLLK